MKRTITPSSSNISWTQISKTIFSLLTIFFFFFASKAQDCTVNAGIDQTRCITYFSGTNIREVANRFQLVGNASGNINSTPNRLWELVSAPAGSITSIASPDALSTQITANLFELPTGVYKYRLGIDCLTGGRVYDTVSVTITNLVDFQLTSNKTFTNVCADVEDSIKLVGRPLKANESFRIYIEFGSLFTISSTNYPTGYSTNINGPTADSIRVTLKRNALACNTAPPSPQSRFHYYITNGSCSRQGDSWSESFYPNYFNDSTRLLGLPKTVMTKTAQKKIDTVKCGNYDFIAENICIKGVGLPNISVVKLSGSGNFSLYQINNQGKLQYRLYNLWDTVTVGTHNKFEVTYLGNGCFADIKDTIDVYLQSPELGLIGYTFKNSITECFTVLPINGYSYPLIASGTVPANIKFTTSLYLLGAGLPAGSTAYVMNPNAKDTIKIGGILTGGRYELVTRVEDIVTGCVYPGITVSNYLTVNKYLSLPVLRDTAICTGGSNYIYYPTGTFGNAAYDYDRYLVTILNYSGYQFMSAANNYINVGSGLPAGAYDIRVSPNPSNTCNDGRSDTFRLIQNSRGVVSNAGTDQNLQCNVPTTNLAGNGTTGFWKFLPAISMYTGAPPTIADTTNPNTLLSNFTNLSTYYYSWNATNSVSGNYCNLQPDTVRLVYSGVAPSSVQAAQIDYTGNTPMSGIYNLTSTAVVPTFSVVWSQITGNPVTIVSTNSQNTNVTGVQPSNSYSFELLVTNACGTFKDTVTLVFNGTLPVTLVNFSGYEQNEQNVISWKSTNEINLKEYQLEYSNNALDFASIKTIAANLSSNSDNNYSTIHNPLLKGISYYRLKIIDNDGRFSYSNILKLNAQKSSIVKLETYPNPAKDVLQVNLNALENAKDATFIIINALGLEKVRLKVNIFKGSNNFSINVKELPAGIYFLKYNDVVNKIVKE